MSVDSMGNCLKAREQIVLFDLLDVDGLPTGATAPFGSWEVGHDFIRRPNSGRWSEF